MQSQQSNQNRESETPAGHIEHLLVAVDADLLERASTDDTLIRRAVWLAQGTGACIELFHISDGGSKMTRWLRSRQEQVNERIESADSAATRLAEFAVNIAAESGLAVKHDARWADDEVQAIVQKATECRTDIVLKTTERAGYLVGLLDHPDWTLIRQSPAHIWFVGDDHRAPRHLLAALGTGNDTRQTSMSECDRQVSTLAALLGRTRQVRTSILQMQSAAAAGGKDLTSAPCLIDTFPLDPVATNLIERPPRDAIPTLAKALDADLILMGATSLTRLDRLLRPVTEEPVLARTTCDVAFLRPSMQTESSLPAEPPVQGLPAVDIQRALSDPDIVFNHSPEKLAKENRLSVDMRRRLLRIWEQDLKATLTAEDDGGPDRLAEHHLRVADELSENDSRRPGRLAARPPPSGGTPA